MRQGRAHGDIYAGGRGTPDGSQGQGHQIFLYRGHDERSSLHDGASLVEMHTIEDSGNKNHLRFMVHSQVEPN